MYQDNQDGQQGHSLGVLGLLRYAAALVPKKVDWLLKRETAGPCYQRVLTPLDRDVWPMQDRLPARCPDGVSRIISAECLG
jgi:hypothetical protein